MIIKKTINGLFNPPVDGQPAILLIRLMTGGVFFWEGILKFVYPNPGVGRFNKLGFPIPEFTAHFVAVTEIAGGLLLLFGLLTMAVALYFIVAIIVAILATKISLYLGTSPLPMPPAPPKIVPWDALHEIRSDYAQLLTSLFLLLAGAGSRS